jgi:hypothetical protein
MKSTLATLKALDSRIGNLENLDSATEVTFLLGYALAEIRGLIQKLEAEEKECSIRYNHRGPFGRECDGIHA